MRRTRRTLAKEHTCLLVPHAPHGTAHRKMDPASPRQHIFPLGRRDGRACAMEVRTWPIG